MCSFATFVRWLLTLLLSLVLTAITATAGVVCDAVGDFLVGSVASENTYDFVDQTWTVCTKFTTTATGLSRFIMTKGGANPRWYLMVLTDGRVQAGFKNTAGEDIGYRYSTTSVNDGALHSVCAVYTSHSTTRNSNVQTVYVDGVVNQGAQQNTGTGGFAQNGNVLNVCRLVGSSNLFDGTIEELAIWTGNIGADAALQYHQNGVKRVHIAAPLVSYWPLWDCAIGATCTTFADERGTSELTSTGAVGSAMAIPMQGDVQ